MKWPFGFRALLAVSSALAILLATLAAVQYRWSTRVAAADAQREREHLDTAASLFANEFNDAVAKANELIQNDAQTALKSGVQLPPLPKLIEELYYLDVSAQGRPQVKRLNAEGFFVASPLPAWMPPAHCPFAILEQPLALASPVFDISRVEKGGALGVRILRTSRNDRCLIARLDERYLRQKLFPQLLKESFGETSLKEYDFAVVPRNRSGKALYGEPLRADVEKPFFSVSPIRLPPGSKALQDFSRQGRKNMLFVQRYESTVITAGTANQFFGQGIWALAIAHKGVPLAEAFERKRRRDLLLSLGVEALLGAAIVFLVIGVRRMQRLAEQKMQFVAAVSHELRAPVSAISMLSRNQADGLVTGGERVQQYGELIHQQSRRLNEMVERTLQYAGIHSNLGRPAKTEIDLRRLINETVDARRDELARHSFEIEVEVDDNLPAVYGDANLLRIAIQNLLSNVEKYAGGGRWVGVRVEYSATEKEVLISVEDRGPGIDSADQAQIFEPFFRGHAVIDAQIPGSGIGLSLVRSAAEAHRGTVTLVSRPGRGSTFTLHLPV